MPLGTAVPVRSCWPLFVVGAVARRTKAGRALRASTTGASLPGPQSRTGSGGRRGGNLGHAGLAPACLQDHVRTRRHAEPVTTPANRGETSLLGRIPAPGTGRMVRTGAHECRAGG